MHGEQRDLALADETLYKIYPQYKNSINYIWRHSWCGNRRNAQEQLSLKQDFQGEYNERKYKMNIVLIHYWSKLYKIEEIRKLLNKTKTNFCEQPTRKSKTRVYQD